MCVRLILMLASSCFDPMLLAVTVTGVVHANNSVQFLLLQLHGAFYADSPPVIFASLLFSVAPSHLLISSHLCFSPEGS